MKQMPKTGVSEAPSSQQRRAFHGGRFVDIVGVTGSIPVTPTIRTITYDHPAKCPPGSLNLGGRH